MVSVLLHQQPLLRFSYVGSWVPSVPCAWSIVLFLRKYFLGLCRNMIGTAAQYYKATLNVTTGLSAPYNNLAIIYKQQVSHSPVNFARFLLLHLCLMLHV